MQQAYTLEVWGFIMTTANNCEEFRQAVINALEERLLDKSQDVGDPFWTSSFGSGCGSYNAAKWAVRGYSAATMTIEKTNPIPGETVKQYAKRLEEVLQVLRQDFYADPDDEDGFATGALVEAINKVKQLSW
jgi:hypothetical protein